MHRILFLVSLALCACSDAKPASNDQKDIPGVSVPNLSPPFDGPEPNLMMQNDQHYGGYGGYGPQTRRCRDEDPIFCQDAQYKCYRRGVSRACRKTCGLCKEETGCEDDGFDCFMANEYICEQPWFASGCKKSCNNCPTETTQTPTTTQEPEEECVDNLFYCGAASKYKCAIYWFKTGCKKSCGICTPSTTTAALTTTIAATTRTTTPEETTTEEPTTTTMKITSVAPCTNGITRLPTAESTTAMPEIIPTEPVTEAEMCVDSDAKDCHIWESLGLCYNPQFMEEMKKICPLSCGVCTP